MALGKIHEITCVRNGASLVFMSLNTADFQHEGGFTTATSVTKNDISASTADVYVVKIAYPSGSIPANSTTIANLVTAATSAVTTKYGNGELV
jgi:hypothetical protein